MTTCMATNGGFDCMRPSGHDGPHEWGTRTTGDRPMSEPTERFLRITRPGLGWYIGEWELAKEELSLTLTESEPGEVVSFEVVEMTRAEYLALPEFEGW